MARSGNWDRVIRRLQNFQRELDAKMYQAVAQSAEYVKSTAVGHLKDQDLGWQALKSRYLARKKRVKGRGSRSLPEKILIATGTYFQSITSYIEGLTAFIGVKRGVAREADGTDILDIARVHEEGAPQANIPARKLWEPTFEETKPEIIKRFKQALQEVLRK